MIGSITGQVGQIGNDWVLVHTSGGVGYKIFTTTGVITECQIGAPAELVTHLVVREDHLTLYGFKTQAELNFFAQLISVSGVGPKSALGIVNAGKVDDLKSAISKSDTAIFTTISGIGKKTAERIVIELRSKLESGLDIGEATHDLVTALSALGYNAYEVRKVLPQIPSDITDTEEQVRYALKLIGK